MEIHLHQAQVKEAPQMYVLSSHEISRESTLKHNQIMRLMIL